MGQVSDQTYKGVIQEEGRRATAAPISAKVLQHNRKCLLQHQYVESVPDLSFTLPFPFNIPDHFLATVGHLFIKW